MVRALWVAASLLAARTAAADDPTPDPTPTPVLASDNFAWREGGPVLIDGGLTVGFPTALPTGLSRGVGAGVTYGHCPFRWGARAAWVTATEYTQAFEVTHSDLRLRATASLQHDAGRGSFGLRLAAGGTLVHETRTLSQGGRAGTMADDTSAFAMVPAADLEAVVALHLIGPWSLMMSGGPSAAIVSGDVHGSWTAELGVAWQP